MTAASTATDVASQIEAIDSGALVRTRPDLATLRVTGEERQSWLSGLVTQDIKPLQVGEGTYALHVTKQGRIISELWLAIDSEQILLGVPQEVAGTLQAAMDQYLIMEDAEIEVAEPHSWFLAHGPKADAVMAAAREAGAIAAKAQLGELATAIVVGTPQLGPKLGEALCNVKGAVLATAAGWERIRIERMLPRWNVDFRAKQYPQEACLEHLAVSFKKGCYVGQEAVFMLEKRGHVAKRLVRLELEGVDAPASGTLVTTPEGDKVGEVTSSIADDGKTWALALVRYKQTLSGTELRIAERPATVACLAVREGGACV